MNQNIKFSNNIHFYFNAIYKLDKIITKNKNIIIVCSKRGQKEILKKKLIFLKRNKISWITNIENNPSKSFFQKLNLAKVKFDYLIAYGGGTAIDTAKVIKAMISEKKDIDMLLKMNNKFEKKTKIKFVAIPTTSGTGSEVTPYATVWDKKNKKKLSINSKFLIPNIVILDPSETIKLPRFVMISSAMDALNQTFDSFWNKKFNKRLLSIASESIKFLILGLKLKITKKLNKEASKYLAYGSILSGFCIKKTRTSICHSMSYPLTLHYNIPHGLACIATMPGVFYIILKKNNKKFDKLLIEMKYKNLSKFFKDLDYIFNNLQIKKHILSFLKSKNHFTNKKNEMLTPGRADNFIYKLDDNILDEILNYSSNFYLKNKDFQNILQ